MRRLVGVDPGLGGALALFTVPILGDPYLLELISMPLDGANDINGPEIRVFLDQYGADILYIERTQGVMSQSAAASHNFGRGTGLVEGVAIGIGIPVKRVSPIIWKRHFSLVGKDKTASRRLATEKFPEYAARFKRVKDDGLAEAALIGLYGVTDWLS